jgi:hypothetical protein
LSVPLRELSEVLPVSLPAPQAETARPRASAATPGAAMRRRAVRFTWISCCLQRLDTAEGRNPK